MIRATRVLPAGHWNDATADTVVLEFDDRHRRRVVMAGVQGLSFLLDLPDALMLRGGDALVLEDDRLVEVVSAPEALIEIRGRKPGDLARLAWHIGNRHLPAQMLSNAIRIRSDHVIADMLSKLGAKLATIEAPFDPEGGAYAGGGPAHPAGSHGEHDDHGHHDHGHHDHSGHDHHGHDHDKPHEHDHDHHNGKHKHEHR